MTAPRDDMPSGPSQLPVTTAPPAGQTGTALKRLRRGECPVTLSLHPFTADAAQTVTAPAGCSVATIVARHVPDPILRAHLVVELDGIEVDRDSWDVTCVEPGEYLLLRVRPAGDDGAKLLRTVLQIAVIAASVWVGGGAGGLITSNFWAAAAAATVQIVGSLIVNALVPPPQPDFGQGDSLSPTYSVDGARNQRLAYRPMPVLFGEHRVYPPLHGMPVQEIVGDDVYLRYLLNLGPMPLDYDVADIRIGETPITDYAGVEYEIRAKPTDPPITLYRDDPFTESVGALLDGGGWVSRTSQTETTEIVAVLAFPQGLGQVDDQGRNKALSASFEMRYRPTGSSDPWITARPTAPQGNAAATAGGSDRLDWFVGEGDLSNWTANFPEGTAAGAQTETRSEPGRPFRVAMRAAVPKGQYDVEIRRTDTAQGDGKQKFDRLEWAALRSISARDPMPLGDYAYMAVYIKASDQLSGVVDVINLVPKRRAATLDAAIADADDPDLSVVSQANWQGEAATRNVADNALFLYRGAHTAVPLADGRVDWPAWAAFWRWCRDNSYTVDYVIDRPLTRARAAQILCAAGRARPIWINGKLSVVIDGPREDGERQLFTPRSTRGFRWRKAFPGTVHALRVVFTNREQGYREDEMLVFADGYSELGEAGGGPAGTVAASAYEKFELPGVTDPEIIWKLGRFWLYTAQLQTETVEFDVDIESVASRAGDLVAVAHDVMLVGLGSARVAGLTTDENGDVTAITLDQAADVSAGLLVMEAEKSYAIRWREVVETGPSSGTYRVSVTTALPVSTVAGPITSIQLPDPVDPADAPKIGQLVAFGETGKETFPVLIKRIRPGRDFTARIEAVAYAPERFEADSGTVPTFETRITLPRAPRPPTPTHSETHVTDDGIFVRFDVPEAWADNLSGFQVRVRQSPESGSTARFERLPDLTREERVAVLPPGVPGRTYDVEITTMGADGRASDPLIIADIGAADAVPAPAGVTVTPATFTGPGGASIPGVSLQWTAAEDPRLVDLLVYAKPAGADAAQYVVVDTEPPRAGQGDIRGLVPGRAYDFGFAYRDQRGAVTQAWTEVEGITVPDSLVATDAASVGGVASDRVAQAVDDADVMAEVIIREALDRRDRIQAEIDGVWDTFGTANAFLLEVQDWTDQAEQFSIVASSSATTAGNSATAAAGYRDQALTYADNAGNSASAASTSATAAAASETAAGNSATAASGFSGTAQTAATAAGDSASAAAVSATAASDSATAAGNSATAAGGFASDAETQATAAGDSASSASTSATAAASSATAAGNSATAASGSASTASTAATAAGDSASAASTSATAAASSATAAGNSATAASGFSSTAETAATAAGDSASAASTSATAAASASDAAGDSATAASGFASDASASATGAGEEAAATLTLRTEAQTAASNAATSATQAATASTNAASSATAASNSATAAGNSATASSSSAATADTHRAAAEANAVLAAQYGASSKTDVIDAEDFFTSDLAGLDYSAAAFTGWTEDSISSVGPVVYSTTSTISFGSRARFNPKPGRRYRVTAIWRWTTGTVGTVSVGFRADPLDTGSATNRWSAVTAGSVNEWREASYEITATEGMAEESWRPVIYRTGNTGRIEVRALVWEDLSAFRAAGEDSTTVYSTAEEAYAARMIQTAAGAESATITLVARQSNGEASSRIVIAANTIAFGEDELAEISDNGEIIGWNAERTVKMFYWDPASENLEIRKSDGTLQWDSDSGGVTIDGVPAESRTQIGSLGIGTNVTLSGTTLVCDSDITGMYASGAITCSGYLFISTGDDATGSSQTGSWDLTLTKTGETPVVLVSGTYTTSQATPTEDFEAVIPLAFVEPIPFGGDVTLQLNAGSTGTASGRIRLTRSL